MLEFFTFVVIALIAVPIGLTIALFRLHARVTALERRLVGQPWHDPVAEPAPPVVPPSAVRPEHAMPQPARPAPAAPPPRPAPRPPLPSRPRIDFESLIGGRLPIWIGGLALVVGGIFLVRLSIESGWLGPAIRTVMAAAFALALLAAAEVARRLPATRDDPRVGQVLAGAGIASSYATLYLAAALYHLVGPLAGFAMMLAITAVGLFLALRHGPPTALMALIGGFAAPLVAGYDAAGIGPLLVYLGLFVAALLALATVRGWAWLALAAMAAAFGWAGLLIALLPADRLGGVGGFIVALAIAGTLAAPGTGVARPWLRMAPIVAALVQLLILAPALDFGVLAWSFYLVLSAAALFLAWRDATLLPAALAATVLVAVLVGAGLAVDGGTSSRIALLLATALFGGVGGALSRRAPGWAWVALAGGAGPLIVAQGFAPALLLPAGWAGADVLLAGAAAALAWRHRDRTDRGDAGLVGGIAVAALGVGLAVATILPDAWIALAPLAAGGVLLAALRFDARAIGGLATVPWLLTLTIAESSLGGVVEALFGAVAFDPLPYADLPPMRDALRTLLLPGIAAGAAAWWRPAMFGPTRPVVMPVQTAMAILGLYVLCKQPLAIATLPRFVELGFVERALLTDIVLLGGWWLWSRWRLPAMVLVGLALARIVWFDAIGLNPALVEQRVGALPVLNAATLHLALAAAVVWRLRGLRFRHWTAAALTLAGALATIRQIAHGTLLTGPVGVAENWGYSAAMLALAILWLWRGLATGAGDLRRLGLGLLTVTTLKVFLIDASALGGVLRILSFMGLGVALIAIGWAYRRFLRPAAVDNDPPAGPAPA